MKYFFYLLSCLLAYSAMAQPAIYPSEKQVGVTVITNGTIHTGAGSVLPKSTLVIRDGKIEKISAQTESIPGATVIDASGKNIYPGLILANTDLGLKEIGSGVRASNDFFELGEYNPNVRSLVAYNTDSRIINTLRSNGILLAHVAPAGRLLAGSSSVVQLDAWTWEDAVYKADNGMFLNLPALFRSPRSTSSVDPIKQGMETLDQVKQFFKEAQAYQKTIDSKEAANLKFEALRSLFEKKQKLFIHANTVRQILMAIDFAKTFGIEVVVVGGSESYQVAHLLSENQIPVILNSIHALPTLEDDDVDQAFKTPAILKKAGVLFALNDDESGARYRNLCFMAGTAASYGLTATEALQAITLDAARILGIADRTGSLEVGKDANIIITTGDILDMKESVVTDAFIQGRKINLANQQTLLYDRYRHRYKL